MGNNKHLGALIQVKGVGVEERHLFSFFRPGRIQRNPSNPIERKAGHTFREISCQILTEESSRAKQLASEGVALRETLTRFQRDHRT
jgi:hypothetical protein